MRDGRAAGVLAIGSRSARPEIRAELGALIRLLAAETANALERTDLLAALDASARTDQLTGVPNRRAWDEVLPRELARARRAQGPISVAILDLDHFKAYNDTHGHPAGDRLLREAAAAWTERMRTTDTLARYGGEEFALVLPGCNHHAAGGVLGELRTALPDGVTCSIGVATWDGREDPEALVARADAALYRAKRDGRDRVVVAG
jgi:diguanylate cyclase (GGDEF)-like protein